MIVPISYTKHGNSKLATVVSFVGGLFLTMGILMAVVLLVSGEFMGIFAGAMIALMGVGLDKLAEKIAASKAKNQG